MFPTIFKQELKYWFKKPSFYVYSILFFFISTFISAAIAGFFDFLTVSTGSAEIINSPTGIYGVFGAMEYLIFFFLPSIIGISTYRDFKSNIHSILFSYPFSKADYLLAKFFSSTLIVAIIMVVVSIGMFVGFRLPGTNPDIVTSFNLIAYLQTYFVSILPNLLLLGSIVFSVVTFTRNISAGFITVIVFIFLQVALSSILNDPAQDYLLGLLDPFGSESFHYYTKNWTVAERNEFLLPIESLVIINRMLWLAIATIIFILTYRKFSFNQSAYILKLKKAKEERVTKQNFGGTKKITLPKVKYNFTFKQRLIATWRISKMEYKYIVKSWPFMSILLLGLIFLFLSTFTMGEIFGTAIRPTTWQMLSVPAGSFFLFINILTFLYSGMLVHRSRMNNVNHLVDATPIPNWSLMASKIIAVIRMQILLLFIIMVSGIVFQIVKGYYNFEIGHYIFELFGLRLLHFMIWAMLAVFIQTLIRAESLNLF